MMFAVGCFVSLVYIAFLCGIFVIADVILKRYVPGIAKSDPFLRVLLSSVGDRFLLCCCHVVTF